MHEFKSDQSAGADANNELLEIWIARYLPNLGAISSCVRHHTEKRLRLAISDSSRAMTTQKLKRYLAIDCAQAATDTYKLLLATGSHIEVWQLKNLSTRIHDLYETLIECYAESFVFSPTIDYLHTIDAETERLKVAGLVIPRFENLLLTIAPILRELKAIYFSSVNRHLLGFMTTQIHFTRQHILSHLDLDESIWISPYLQLVDELICIPWQHICSVVASTQDRSEAVTLARKMLPKMSAISALTYQKALQTYPKHTSCQGRIQSAAVQRSSLRDLSMFQAYIWLCVLDDSVVEIEKKLLPICLQVFPLTNVSWDLVTFAIKIIVETIQSQINPLERNLFDPQAETIKNLFEQSAPQQKQIALLKGQLQQDQPTSAGSVSYTWQANGPRYLQ
ncbi:MAG: hypothetical protein AAF579_12750 [Cyanobacteria bacterium P01_C01_bin.118]